MCSITRQSPRLRPSKGGHCDPSQGCLVPGTGEQICPRSLADPLSQLDGREFGWLASASDLCRAPPFSGLGFLASRRRACTGLIELHMLLASPDGCHVPHRAGAVGLQRRAGRRSRRPCAEGPAGEGGAGRQPSRATPTEPSEVCGRALGKFKAPLRLSITGVGVKENEKSHDKAQRLADLTDFWAEA